MHAAQKISHRLFGAIETAEDGAIDAEGLLPAGRALTHGIAQIAPYAKQRFIGITHVPAERLRTAAVQIVFGQGLIAVDSVFLDEQPQCGTAIEKPFERAGVEFQFLREVRRGSRTFVQAVEDAQRFGGEHGLGMAKGLDEIEDRLRVRNGHAHTSISN